MALIRIFRDDLNIYSNVNLNIKRELTVNADGFGPSHRYFIEIITDLVKTDGSSFDPIYLYNLADLPPGVITPVTTYTALINEWLDYLVNEAQSV